MNKQIRITSQNEQSCFQDKLCIRSIASFQPIKYSKQFIATLNQQLNKYNMKNLEQKTEHTQVKKTAFSISISQYLLIEPQIIQNIDRLFMCDFQFFDQNQTKYKYQNPQIFLLSLMSDQDESQQFQIKSKRKSDKKGQNVPFGELGFRPKVYYDIYQNKPKKYIAKFKKNPNSKAGKQSYLSRLTFVVDSSQLSQQQLKEFKGTKKGEWDKIVQIIIRSRDKIECCICLTQQIVAPQMTKCGHVYCWHCILMHFQKSLRNNHCPVCNEFIDSKDIKSCKPIYQNLLGKGDTVNMQLKVKNSANKVFFPQSLHEDLRCCKVVRMLRNGILSIFNEQSDQLSAFLKKNQYPEYQDYIIKAISLSSLKIDRFKQKSTKNGIQLLTNQVVINDCITECFDQQNQSIQTAKFYQQQSGRNMFFHPITEKFMKSCFSQKWPRKIQVIIFEKEQYECTIENNKKNKYLSHLPLNADAQIVLAGLDDIINQEKVLAQYKKELSLYRKVREKEQEEQRIQAERLTLIYEKEQDYMKKLKQMTRQQFFDISVPSEMHPSQMNEQTFPSLNGNSSSKSQSGQKNSYVPNKLLMTASTPSSNQNKGSKNEASKLVVNDQEFPDLSANLIIKKANKSESTVETKGKGKKKRKKDQFVDVTKQFFNQDDQEYN